MQVDYYEYAYVCNQSDFINLFNDSRLSGNDIFEVLQAKTFRKVSI